METHKLKEDFELEDGIEMLESLAKTKRKLKKKKDWEETKRESSKWK